MISLVGTISGKSLLRPGGAQWCRQVDAAERAEPAQPEADDGRRVAASERSAGRRRQRRGVAVRLRPAGRRVRRHAHRARAPLVPSDAAHGPPAQRRRAQRQDRRSHSRGASRRPAAAAAAAARTSVTPYRCKNAGEQKN